MEDLFNFSQEELSIVKQYENSNSLFKFSFYHQYIKDVSSLKAIYTDVSKFIEIGRDFDDNIVYISIDNRGTYIDIEDGLTKINKNILSYIYFLGKFDRIDSLYKKSDTTNFSDFCTLFEDFIKFRLDIKKNDNENWDNFYWRQFIMFGLEVEIDAGVKKFFSDNKVPITILQYIFLDELNYLNENNLEYIYTKYFVHDFIDISTSIENITKDFYGSKIYTDEEIKRLKEMGLNPHAGARCVVKSLMQINGMLYKRW